MAGGDKGTDRHGGGGDSVDQTVVDSDSSVETSVMTSDKVREVLAESEEFLKFILEGMVSAGEAGKELPKPVDREAVARVIALVRQVEKRVLVVLPEAPFRLSQQVKPSSAAHNFIERAKLMAIKEQEEKMKRGEKIARNLVKVFSFKVDIEDSNIMDRINAFAVKNAGKGGLDVNMVIAAFSDPKSEFYLGVTRFDLESCFKEPSVEDIITNPRISVFRSGVLPSKYFEQILHGKVAALVMDLNKAWQARMVEGENENEFLSILMKNAKIYIERTFSTGFLGRKLIDCDSLKELQVYASALPVDKESFELLKKAHLLLKVMHIMILHDSEVNISSYFYNSDNLREEMDDFSVSLPNGSCYLNPPRKDDGTPNMEFEEDFYGIEVDRVEVADGKPVYSAIDKVVRKEMYDTTEIGDWARMRIFLAKNDCYDEDGTFNSEKTEKAMEKVLGLMISRFGNDINVDSLDYSVDTGKTNEASKGAHRGLHFNFKYKSSCNKNGLTPHGEPLTRSIDVEGQILVYMPKDDYDADHKEYQKSRRALLFRVLGFENGFHNFVMDLISAVSNDKYDFKFRSLVDPFDEIVNVDEEVRKVYERQFGFGNEVFFPEAVDLSALMEEGWILFSEDKLRLFVLLLDILTKKNEEGGLENNELISYMEKYFPGKLRKLMIKLAKILKSPEFKDGGEKAYLKRVIEAKMYFVKGVISTGGKSIDYNRRNAELFRTPHSFRVTNVSRRKKGKGPKKIAPKLVFVTHFPKSGGKSGDKMEIPYDGPIGLVGIPRDGGNVIDFCWQLQNGKKTKPVYRIEYKEEDRGISCNLITENQELLMWFIDVDFNDESGLMGRIHECSYEIIQGVDNRSKIVSGGIDPEGKNIFVKGLSSLNPTVGMSKDQSRFIKLVEVAGKIWSQAKAGKIKYGEYPVVV